jgi:hypothetical protein
MRKTASSILLLLVVVALSMSSFITGSAQTDAWSEVVDSNGNIDFSNLTDLGEVNVPADWMPNVPFIDGVATYHQYQTPSGNIVVLPSATTYFFMALNPTESGLNMAAGGLSGNAQSDSGYVTTASHIAGLIGMMQGTVSGQQLISSIQNLGYANPADFFSAVVSGQENIWSLPTWDTLNFLGDLLGASLGDGNLYAVLLMYSPDMCASLPGGCPPGFPPTPPPPGVTVTPPPLPITCDPPQTTIGAISMTAIKLAPNHPIVVGQDPEKRGADLSYSITIGPTIRRIWTAEAETECRPGPTQNGNYNCDLPGPGNQRGHEVITDWYCEEHVEVYRESLTRVSTAAALAQSSRDWILNELSIRYPGARLKRPTWAWGGNPGTGGFQGDTFVWTYEIPGIQFADPGYYALSANGATTGTPITPPRNFNLTNGLLEVWLKETAIIH